MAKVPSKHIRSVYGERQRRLSSVSGESKTLQSAKKECDVNEIMRQFRENGILPVEPSTTPLYEDVGSVPDYLEGQIRLSEYRNYFSTLPSYVRASYANDYRNMLSDAPENLAKLGLFGLIPEPPATGSGNVLLDNTLPVDTDIKETLSNA